MIYLYTLPGTAFNCPQISIPLLKGYLKNSGITSKQYDLSATFLEKCFTKNYIKRLSLKYYNSLNENEKDIIENIENSIKELKYKYVDTSKIISANYQVLQYLNIIGNFYNVKWRRRGIDFSKKISTIDDVIELAFDKNNSLFDIVLVNEQDLRDGDIIYLSIQYPFQLNYAIRFSKYLKSQNDEIKIIFGGDYITHINKNLEELMKKCLFIDGITLFGNYDNVVKLIEMFKKNEKTSNINNTIYRLGNKILFNYNIAKEEFYKERYVPDFSGLNLNKYLSNLKLISLTLNYGCYHSQCMFCSRYFYYNGYHCYDIDRILEYIKFLYESEHIEAIYFIDECVPPDILIKLSKYLIENNIKIKWMVETRIHKKYLDIAVANLLYESGCREISFGIESNNRRILNDMKKGIDLNDAKKVMKNFFNSGISVSATFMIGYPTENILNIIKTLTFIKKFKYLDTFGLSVFNYMRNSKIVNLSNLDESQDLNLIYRTTLDNHDECLNIIEKFNKNKKIHKFITNREKILYRSEYMYLDREFYSLNYKRGESMTKKTIFKKIDKNELKSKIYLKELKPEMTQCRIVQVDNKIKEKTK